MDFNYVNIYFVVWLPIQVSPQQLLQSSCKSFSFPHPRRAAVLHFRGIISLLHPIILCEEKGIRNYSGERRRVKATHSLAAFAYPIKLNSTKSTPCCYERKIMHILILYFSHCFSLEKRGYCNSSLVEICKAFTHLVHKTDNPCSWEYLFISY